MWPRLRTSGFRRHCHSDLWASVLFEVKNRWMRCYLESFGFENTDFWTSFLPTFIFPPEHWWKNIPLIPFSPHCSKIVRLTFPHSHASRDLDCIFLSGHNLKDGVLMNRLVNTLRIWIVPVLSFLNLWATFVVLPIT